MSTEETNDPTLELLDAEIERVKGDMKRLTIRLRALQSARDRIAEAEGQPPERGPPPAPKRLQDRIAAVFHMLDNQGMSPEEVRQRLLSEFGVEYARASVNTCLHRNSDLFERVRYGTYRLRDDG